MKTLFQWEYPNQCAQEHMALAKCRRDYLQQGGYIGGYFRATVMYACNPAQDRLNDCEYNEALVGIALQERVR